MNLNRTLITLAAVALTNVSSTISISAAENWPSWRGPGHNGVSRSANPPLEWSEEKNVQWKTAIPGAGNSTPIVWGDKVFVLTAINTGIVDPGLPKPEDQPQRVFGIKRPNTTHSFFVLCLDRETGREIWRRRATDNIPHQGHHKDASFASSSPITDGERLYCWFGSTGLFCYDLDGKLLWQRDLGHVHVGADLGEGTSPALYDGKLVIVRDHARQSYIEMLDAKTGEKIMELEDKHQYGVTEFLFHPDGKHFFSAGRDTVIRVWNLEDGKLVKKLGEPRGGQFKDWIHAIDISADGKLLAAADMAGQVNIW